LQGLHPFNGNRSQVLLGCCLSYISKLLQCTLPLDQALHGLFTGPQLRLQLLLEQLKVLVRVGAHRSLRMGGTDIKVGVIQLLLLGFGRIVLPLVMMMLEGGVERLVLLKSTAAACVRVRRGVRCVICG
jgi:hypothetical protein